MQTVAPSITLSGRRIVFSPRAGVGFLVGEIRGMSIGLRLWFAFLLGILGLTAIAALIALPPGWEVFGTTPSFEWGLLIIGYVFFAIMTSGLCLASSLGTVFGIQRFMPLEKRHAILAVLSLTAAFGIIALDLHYPIRMVFGAVLVPSPTSPMWWMGVFYGIYLCCLLVEVWSMFTGHPLVHQWACVASSCMAIIAPATLGAVFAILAVRSFWHDPLSPVLMVSSALALGTSLLGIVFYAVYRTRRSGWERARSVAMPSIRILLAIAIVLVSVLLARHVLVGLNGTMPGQVEAADALVSGPLAVPFWGRVGLGLLVPLVILALPWTSNVHGTFAASTLAFTGILVDRYLFVAAGQIAPVTTSAGTVSYPFAPYVPSPVEIMIVIGAGAFVAFGYTLAERYLDLSESDAHVAPAQWVWYRIQQLAGRDVPDAARHPDRGDAVVAAVGDAPTPSQVSVPEPVAIRGER
jgi:molybdopterin-containing oxidoreductase family membrane subunit